MISRFYCSLFLLLVITSSADAQQCSSYFLELNPLQIRANAMIKSGQYVTQRSYYDYMKAFGDSFVDDMLTLNEKDVWVDLGAGTGQALKDFSDYKKARKEKRPQLMGISTQDASYDTNEKSISWLGGRLWEEIHQHELPAKIDRATDFYGILSYTDQVSNYMNEVFLRMPVGGKFYSYLSDRDAIREETSIFTPFFSAKSFVDYFCEIPNLQIEEKVVWNYFTLQKMRVITLTKLGDVQFPELEMIKYKEGSPPHRTFKMK